MTGSTGMLLAVGCYTDPDAGEGVAPGLTTWWWDGSTGIRRAGSADLPSPSFVCWHPTLPLLYAVSELPAGTVTTLAVGDDGAPRVLATTSTGGGDPCWVTTDPAGRALLIANYGSGSMAVLALDAAGLPAGDPTVIAHRGSGPVADRQEGPHVHQVVPTASGTVLASDLGADRIVEYRIDTGPAAAPAVTVTPVGSVDMPTGSGTRHIALASDGVTGFVTGELDATVTVIRRRPGGTGGPGDTGTWMAAEQVPCAADGTALPSQVLLAEGDRWLLVANRGPDTLAVLDVARGLAIHQEIPVGAFPRYFTVDAGRVLVACQRGDAVQALALDGDTGTLTALGDLDAGAAPARFHTPSGLAVRHVGR